MQLARTSSARRAPQPPFQSHSRPLPGAGLARFGAGGGAARMQLQRQEAGPGRHAAALACGRDRTAPTRAAGARFRPDREPHARTADRAHLRRRGGGRHASACPGRAAADRVPASRAELPRRRARSAVLA
ncbi:MAG: hypothetical protein EBT30_09600 [Verrucomicrobia bacterium]|nr:hypothetical protein [Verrucomicrobiota bacterium]